MDPERVAARPQPEVTPPVLGEEKPATIPLDPFTNIGPSAKIDTRNFSPAAGNVLSSPNSEKSEVSETLLQHHPSILRHHPSNVNDHLLKHRQSPPPVRRPDSGPRRETRINNDNRSASAMQAFNVDWIVPSTEEKAGRRTVGERLQPTLDIAIVERDKYATKARWTGYALNAAIGLQVLLGSLTTGLSALAVSGKSTAMSTTALGAMATLVASYLARARGSNEPELSITRNKDLDQFIRECRAFQMDHGHTDGDEFNNELIGFRRRFEELLGNANGERRLAPPV